MRSVEPIATIESEDLRMTLQIELPPDVEACYMAEAMAKGVSLERVITEHLIESTRGAGPAVQPARPLNLPLMKGNVIGSLSRRDIYDDHR